MLLKNILSFFIFLLSLTISHNINAQDHELFEKEIQAGEYIFYLTNDDIDFFKGSIRIEDKNNITLRNLENFYSGFNWDTLIDMNNDGIEELVMDLGTGISIYDHNMLLVFDLSNDTLIISKVKNAELITNIDEVPKILSHVRLSPSVYGAGYEYSMKYENGRLVLENNPEESKVLKSLDIKDNNELYLLKEYEQELDECAEDSQVSIYYLAYIIQQKILGKEEKGWEFFDKNYKCEDKIKLRYDLSKYVNESYEYIKNTDFELD